MEKKKIENIFMEKVLGACKLTKDILDERGNKDHSEWPKTQQTRGGFNYYPPNNRWIGFGLKVWDVYDNGNNDWIAKDNNPNEWTVAYHGTSFSAVQPICRGDGKFFSSIEEGAIHQKCRYFINVNKKSQNEYHICGEGASFSSNFKHAAQYSRGVIIMCRVNPNKLRIPERFGENE